MEWTGLQLRKSGVSIQCDTAVTEVMLADKKPDTVVLATGAIPVTLPISRVWKSSAMCLRRGMSLWVMLN